MSTTTTAPHTTTDADVVVVGGGMGGLTVAYDLARAGLRVIVCEASDAVGGLLRRGRVGGVALDLGAESFATRTDAVPALVADAGLDLELISPRPGGSHLAVADLSRRFDRADPRNQVQGYVAFRARRQLQDAPGHQVPRRYRLRQQPGPE